MYRFTYPALLLVGGEGILWEFTGRAETREASSRPPYREAISGHVESSWIPKIVSSSKIRLMSKSERSSCSNVGEIKVVPTMLERLAAGLLTVEYIIVLRTERRDELSFCLASNYALNRKSLGPVF